MRDIAIKFTPTEFEMITGWIDQLKAKSFADKSVYDRIAISIMLSLSPRFSASFYNIQKAYNRKLKYHEAAVIVDLAVALNENESSPYRSAIMYSIISKIQPQL